MVGLSHPLSSADNALLVAAMLLTADSDLFPDWEFHTLMGADRQEVRTVAAAWPEVDGGSDVVLCAALNSLNNLVGYPHGRTPFIEERLGVAESDLAALRGRVAAALKDDPSGAGRR